MHHILSLCIPFFLSVTSLLPFLPPVLLPWLCHLFSLSSLSCFFTIFYFLLLFRSPSVSLPFSLSLVPLSSFPRGYYLSRRQICPIINLISSFSLFHTFTYWVLLHPHLLSVSHIHRSKSTNKFTQAHKQSPHFALLHCLFNFLPTHTHIHTCSHTSLPSCFCHTVKSQLYTLPPFSSSLLLTLSLLSCHHHADMEWTTTTKKGEEESRR